MPASPSSSRRCSPGTSSTGAGIRERLTRILATTRERFVGDVAAFYLTYAEPPPGFEPEGPDGLPEKRPKAEVVAGFLAAR